MAYTDRFPIVKNFLETKLTADCDAGENTLYLENVDGLPTILSGRDYVPLVLRDAGTVREIVYVDAVDNTAGTVTVRRGQEGTTPAAWATGTYAYCTVTSDSFQRMRVNGFAPLVTDEGRPSISRTSATTVNIVGDFTAQLEVGMAVRVLSGDTVVEPTDAELGAIHITAVSFSAGVTSVSFQNVSLPTKVDGLDLGLSVAAAPLYHPDMVVADEDTLTQTQNVLSVSQKFKDDLKAEQTLVDAAQDAKIAEAKNSADAVAEELAKYLPLTGGTVDWLGLPVGRLFSETADNLLGMVLAGASGSEKGALLALRHATATGNPGGIDILTRNEDGSFGAQLRLYKAGTATWHGKNIVRSVNGVAADAAGNVDISSLASGWGMPSTRVTTMTLGSSGAAYTAPANGYFCMKAISNTDNSTAHSIGLVVDGSATTGKRHVVSSSGHAINHLVSAMMPVRKGEVCRVTYSNCVLSYSGYTGLGLHFIYAEGED